MTEIWAEKYRPRTLDDYIFQSDNDKQQIEQYLKSGTIPNLFFSGVQGCGKSTLARIIAQACVEDDTIDLKVINASKNNSKEYIEKTIGDFISTYAVGQYKIVLLEEADYLSLSAQAVLRGFTEDHIDFVRFIITCNYANKIMPAVKSRFTQFNYRELPYEAVVKRLVSILRAEKIEVDLDVIDQCVNLGAPDIRQTITILQSCVKGNTLVMPSVSSSSGADWKLELINLLEKNQFGAIRTLIETSIPDSEIEEFITVMYKELKKSPKFKDDSVWESGQLIIAEHLYYHAIVASPQINASAMVLKLKRV